MPPNVEPKTGLELQQAIKAAAQDETPKMRVIAEFATTEPEAFVRMSARQICARLNTSEPTLIRFCQLFGHGGLADFRIELALALTAQRPGLSFVPAATDRRRVNRDSKRAIARAALPLVAADRSLLIDNGSTAEAFAEHLADSPAKTVMTNGMMVAQNALLPGIHRVMLTGGDVNPETASLGGRMIERALSEMHFDTFIMGADSIHLPSGVSTYSEAEAHITRAMMERAARVICLADHTKFRRPGLHHICALSQMDILVTDVPLADETMENLTAQNVQVIVAAQGLPDAATAQAEGGRT